MTNFVGIIQCIHYIGSHASRAIVPLVTQPSSDKVGSRLSHRRFYSLTKLTAIDSSGHCRWTLRFVPLHRTGNRPLQLTLRTFTTGHIPLTVLYKGIILGFGYNSVHVAHIPIRGRLQRQREESLEQSPCFKLSHLSYPISSQYRVFTLPKLSEKEIILKNILCSTTMSWSSSFFI